MGKVVEAAAVKTLATGEIVERMTPAVQKQVRSLRDSRNIEKEAKAKAGEARQEILDYFVGKLGGEITRNLIGTDGNGKRLVSIKVIKSSEKIDWATMEKNDPELFATIQAMAKDYVIPAGAGEPTLRVDCI